MAARREWKIAVPAVALTVAAASLLLATCGSPSAQTVEVTLPATTVATTTTTTTVPTTTTTSTSTTTTLPPTTTSTTSTTSTTTSTTSTTTTTTTTTVPVVQESEPIAPPADTRSAEPVIELGTISIPKIGVEMPMYEGIRMTTLDLGPGHWPGSAMPGQIGNVVVGGHRTSKHKVFRKVDELVAGDEIIFTMPDGVFTYVVNRIEVVNPDAIWIIDPTATPTATLFACHPPGSTRQRIVVFADLKTG